VTQLCVLMSEVLTVNQINDLLERSVCFLKGLPLIWWFAVLNGTGSRPVRIGKVPGKCREPSSSAGVVESLAAWAQERLSRCGAFGEAVGVSRADLELPTGHPTAPVANPNAHWESTDA
jgi:hypothetical protein